MATSALIAIRINELLGLQNKLTRAMFFFAKKAVDACREVVPPLQLGADITIPDFSENHCFMLFTRVSYSHLCTLFQEFLIHNSCQGVDYMPYK